MIVMGVTVVHANSGIYLRSGLKVVEDEEANNEVNLAQFGARVVSESVKDRKVTIAFGRALS